MPSDLERQLPSETKCIIILWSTNVVQDDKTDAEAPDVCYISNVKALLDPHSLKGN